MSRHAQHIGDASVALVVICALLAFLSGCRAPSPAWSGVWRLNTSRSNFQGPIFHISISKDGEYRYDDGKSSFTFRCDGRDRLIGKDRTRACVRSSPYALDLTQKESGERRIGNHWELSAHGSVLTMTSIVFSASRPAITGQILASRVSGSEDFWGDWRDTSYLQRHAVLELQLEREILHLRYPAAGQNIDAPLKGTDTPVYGPHAPAGLTYSARRVGPREIQIVTKRNGKVVTQGLLALSNNGRVITESWWSPDRPTDKGMFFYDRD